MSSPADGVLATLPLPRPVPLPLLVTGISGVAGFSAFFSFQRRYPGQVIGIRPTQTFRMTGSGIVALDTENEDDLRGFCQPSRFRSVLNTTGNCALKSCELAPDMAYRTNVLSALHLARCACERDSRLVHLSSDLVFSGTANGGHVETDPVDPVTVYGKTMAEGEGIVAGIHPNAAILRISLPMGPSFNGHAGAIDWIQSRFRAGRPATLYYDEVRTPTYCDDLDRVFAWFLASEARGLYHLGGPRAVSLNQIGQIVNKAGGYESALLRGCLRHEAGPIPPRAGNVSMTSRKLIALLGGNPFHPWPLGDDLVPACRDWHHQHPEDWPGSAHFIEQRLYRYPQ